MDLIKKYEKELAPFQEYRQAYVGGLSGEACPNEDCLQYWEEAKSEYLYRLLGNQLIVSRPITTQINDDDLIREMRKFCYTSEFQVEFLRRLREELFEDTEQYHNRMMNWEANGSDPEMDFYKSIANSMSSVDANTNNIIEDLYPHTARSISYRIKHIKITVSKGDKLFRVLGKLSRLLGLAEFFDGYRNAHSRILNKKETYGTLCLSIHPMDYATASDNKEGWDSCIRWMPKKVFNTRGCYRMGSVELMNSPVVLCAYLASDNNQLEFGDYTWNSKKWRAWVIVTEDCIVIDKNYPSPNGELMQAVFDWVRQLAKENLGIEYGPTIPYHSETEDDITFSTNLMYNDFDKYEYDFSYAVNVTTPRPLETEIEISGIANCMWCGNIYDHADADALCCDVCETREYCCICDRAIDTDDESAYYDDCGNQYCEDCYCERFTLCDCCDSFVPNDSIHYLALMYDPRKGAEGARECARAKSTHWAQTMTFTEDSDFLARESESCSYIVCDDCVRQAGVTDEDLITIPSGNITTFGFLADDPTKNTVGKVITNVFAGNEVINPETTQEEKIRGLFRENFRPEWFHSVWESYKNILEFNEII